MAKFIRYALAAICFAASVGCLALWWRSITQRDVITGPGYVVPSREIGWSSSMGMCTASTNPSRVAQGNFWRYANVSVTESERNFKERFIEANGYFVTKEYGDGAAVYFPLWYPALLFAFIGVAALRFRRQFSIGSALVTLTVVAALLAMVVAL